MSKIEESKTQGRIVHIACCQCDANTKHTVERALDWSDFYDGPDIHVRATYQIVRCNGCDTLSFRSVHSDSENLVHDEFGRMVSAETEKLYPERPERSLADDGRG